MFGHGKVAARQCSKIEWRICYIDDEDMEFKGTTKNAHKKLEVPLESAMPCKRISRRGAKLLRKI